MAQMAIKPYTDYLKDMVFHPWTETFHHKQFVRLVQKAVVSWAYIFNPFHVYGKETGRADLAAEIYDEGKVHDEGSAALQDKQAHVCQITLDCQHNQS